MQFLDTALATLIFALVPSMGAVDAVTTIKATSITPDHAASIASALGAWRTYHVGEITNLIDWTKTEQAEAWLRTNPKASAEFPHNLDNIVHDFSAFRDGINEVVTTEPGNSVWAGIPTPIAQFIRKLAKIEVYIINMVTEFEWKPLHDETVVRPGDEA
jgi:hypothetical protein